jgi:hydroxylamine reductase
MLCYQCEQTAKGTGCTVHGVCGKDPTTAALQDVLFEVTKGISRYAQAGGRDREIDVFAVEALFTTVTNVNFDPDRLVDWIQRAVVLRDRARELAGGGELGGPAAFEPAGGVDALVAQAGGIGIASRQAKYGEDVAGLQELIVYGLKGAAAYLDHAHVLGVEDDEAYALLHELLAFVAAESVDVSELTAAALRVGELNLKAMELLDKANTDAYGHPEPTPVRVTPVAGKAIVVSGHDLKDLDLLLQQTEGKGINIYTHGEMLPAHGYPKLKEYRHLVGNYGGAWQKQQSEFAEFPGAILMTTNCIQKPASSYECRIFTSGLVAWPGVTHISDGDFTPVMKAALAAPGFAEDAERKTILTGFARNAVLGVADKVVEAVKAGAVKHFFLIGGCDGAKPGRNYYTELAQAVPDDCVILTLACGKYRFNKLEFGDIGGIPRLLDVGQCNDAYSAVQIAVALAEAFGCGVNDLPLTIVCSWYEQKAVAILLSLLHRGIKGIKLGPSLPAFVTPPVLNALVEQFELAPISTPQEDLATALA